MTHNDDPRASQHLQSQAYHLSGLRIISAWSQQLAASKWPGFGPPSTQAYGDLTSNWKTVGTAPVFE